MSIYEIDLENAIKTIKDNSAKRVLIQLPDGIKPRAKELVEEIEQKTNARVFIWAGSNFGACDLPSGIDYLKVDLLLHFGHSKWVVN